MMLLGWNLLYLAPRTLLIVYSAFFKLFVLVFQHLLLRTFFLQFGLYLLPLFVNLAQHDLGLPQFYRSFLLRRRLWSNTYSTAGRLYNSCCWRRHFKSWWRKILLTINGHLCCCWQLLRGHPWYNLRLGLGRMGPDHCIMNLMIHFLGESLIRLK
jgi:hypothetical protein